MKAIKFLLGLGLMVASSSVFSQGLEGIVVEKYYQANQADVDYANTACGCTSNLTTSSVTYRVYVDMADYVDINNGYKLVQLFGTPTDNLTVNTTTSFFNDPDYGQSLSPATAAIAANSNMRRGTTMIDSYFTTGAAAGSKAGVLKVDDTDNSIANFNSILGNNPGGCFGSPISGTSGKDGFLPSTAQTLVNTTPVGLGTALNVLDQTIGGSIVISNGALNAQTFVQGPTTKNMVLIGQFTTNGVFTFALNVQLIDPSGNAENYVAATPTGAQQTHPTLTLAPNTPPTINSFVASPASAAIINGTAMTFTVTASDNGTIQDVKFYDANSATPLVPVFTDATSPYVYNYTAVQGSHSITAVVSDNECVTTTSSAIAFTSAPNQAPVVTITAPSNTLSTVIGNSVTLTATATDADNGVTSVQFYKNDVAIGSSIASPGPYTMSYTVTTGNQVITAKAIDALNLEGTSAGRTITGVQNQNPIITIASSPAANSGIVSYVNANAASNAPGGPFSLAPVVLTPSFSDVDGTVTSVQWYLDGTLVTSGVSNNVFTWASTSGTHTIYAIATDNNGGTTTSSTINYVINNALALPYEVKNVSQLCNLPTYCVPVAVSTTYTVANVKGYDIVMTYDHTKVAPATTTVGTGQNAVTTINVDVFATLLAGTGTPAANWVDVTAAVQTPGTLNLSLSLNSNAPANAKWSGTNANLFCVQFNRITPSSPTSAGFQPFQQSTVAVSFLQESRITGVETKSVAPGNMISTTQQNYVGYLEYWNGGAPIQYNSVNTNQFLKTEIQGVLASSTSGFNTLTGLVNGQGNGVNPVLPDMDGKFTHLLSMGTGANRVAVPNIEIKRDIVNNPTTSVQLVINASDAVIAKTLLTNGYISAQAPGVYSMIAMDVNLDGVISAGDVTQMQQRTVGILEEYQQAWNYTDAGVSDGRLSKDWLFIDPASLSTLAYQISTTFPLNDGVGYSKAKVPVVPFYLPVNVTNYNALDETCPVVNIVEYQGIMLGDVNGSIATANADGLIKANETDYILVDLSDVIVEGTKVSVPVSIVSAEPVNAFDLALLVNENTLTYVSEEDVELGASSASFYNESDKTFRHSSFNTNNFTSNAKLAYITFETADGKITEKDLTATLGLLNDKTAEVRFTKSSDLTNNNVDIFPNPSNGMFSVTSKVDGRVDIVDVTGKLVHPGVVVKANQMIEVNMPELSAGVYFVRMYSNNSMTTERIVISE